ncbi:MAG: hypothetical protein ACOVNS_13385, partial [Erythrobacter sp.]
TDGTAYLRAIMENDGNIRYANYQSQQEVINYLTANGFGPDTWAGWFPNTSGGAQGLTEDTVSGAEGNGLDLAIVNSLGMGADAATPGRLNLETLAFAAPAMAFDDHLRAEFY